MLDAMAKAGTDAGGRRTRPRCCSGRQARRGDRRVQEGRSRQGPRRRARARGPRHRARDEGARREGRRRAPEGPRGGARGVHSRCSPTRRARAARTRSTTRAGILSMLGKNAEAKAALEKAKDARQGRDRARRADRRAPREPRRIVKQRSLLARARRRCRRPAACACPLQHADAMSAEPREPLGEDRPALQVEVRDRGSAAPRSRRRSSRPPAVYADTLYIGSASGWFFALRVVERRASAGASSSARSRARRSSIGGMLYVGTHDGFADRARRADRRTRSGATRAAARSSSRRSSTGDLIVFSNEADQVVAVDAITGKFKWQYKAETPEEYTLRGHAGVTIDGDLDLHRVLERHARRAAQGHRLGRVVDLAQGRRRSLHGRRRDAARDRTASSTRRRRRAASTRSTRRPASCAGACRSGTSSMPSSTRQRRRHHDRRQGALRLGRRPRHLRDRPRRQRAVARRRARRRRARDAGRVQTTCSCTRSRTPACSSPSARPARRSSTSIRATASRRSRRSPATAACS